MSNTVLFYLFMYLIITKWHVTTYTIIMINVGNNLKQYHNAF